VQFTDTFEVKKRPAVVLFEELDNVVVAGVTSNTRMQGVPLSRADGAARECVIKVNYIITLASMMVERKLFSLSAAKRRELHEALLARLALLG